MEIDHYGLLNELEEKAEGLSRTEIITDSIQSEILTLLGPIEDTLKQSSITVKQYQKILDRIIESRHGEGVNQDSPYYFFYKSISDILRNNNNNNKKSVGFGINQRNKNKHSNYNNPKIGNVGKIDNTKSTMKTYHDSNGMVKGKKTEYNLEVPLKNQQLAKAIVETQIQTPAETPIQTEIVDSISLPEGLINLHNQRNNNKEEIYELYKNNNFSEIFKYVSILHNNYINCFHPVYQKDIKKLFQAVDVCKDQKLFFIRMYLQNNHLNIYYKIRNLFRSIDLD